MDIRLLAQRMHDTALDYKLASERLSQLVDPRYGGSSTQLGILAFEILLKAVYLLDIGQPAKFGHDYKDGFNCLTDLTQESIIRTGQERYAGHVDFKFPNTYLIAWRHAFTKGRYAYEALEDETDEAARRRGEEWIIRGSTSEGADFAFYPMELDAIFFGLNVWIERKIASR